MNGDYSVAFDLICHMKFYRSRLLDGERRWTLPSFECPEAEGSPSDVLQLLARRELFRFHSCSIDGYLFNK